MADITPERIAELRKLIGREVKEYRCCVCGYQVWSCECEVSLAEAVPELLAEIERLRAVIRQTHTHYCACCGRSKP